MQGAESTAVQQPFLQLYGRSSVNTSVADVFEATPSDLVAGFNQRSMCTRDVEVCLSSYLGSQE